MILRGCLQNQEIIQLQIGAMGMMCLGGDLFSVGGGLRSECLAFLKDKALFSVFFFSFQNETVLQLTSLFNVWVILHASHSVSADSLTPNQATDLET